MNIIIDGNNIFETDIYNQKNNCIGVTTQAFLEIKETAEQALEKAEKFYEEKEAYFNKLVDAGLEEKKKTPEEINKEIMIKLEEQQKVNEQLMQSILTLNNKLDKNNEEVVLNEREKFIGNSKQIGNSTEKNKSSAKNG